MYFIANELLKSGCSLIRTGYKYNVAQRKLINFVFSSNDNGTFTGFPVKMARVNFTGYNLSLNRLTGNDKHSNTLKSNSNFVPISDTKFLVK